MAGNAGASVGSSSFAEIVGSTQRAIFDLYEVTVPSDAQRMKALFYLCISGIAMLNDLAGASHQNAVDELIADVQKMTKPLSMRIGDLASSEEELEKLLSAYPAGVGMDKETTVNGLAAFDGLYSAHGRQLVEDIYSHRHGPDRTPGYAAIVVGQRVFGGVDIDKHFLVLIEMFKFSTRLNETALSLSQKPSEEKSDWLSSVDLTRAESHSWNQARDNNLGASFTALLGLLAFVSVMYLML